MSRRNLWWVVCLAVISPQALSHGQQPSALQTGAPAFEVASVRRNQSGELGIRIDLPAPDRFTATNIPLRDLIRFAYDVEDRRLVGGPDWIRSERFDVVATADRELPAWGPSGPPVDMLRMVRTLLAQRFGLVVHQETRTLPVFALVMAKEDRAPGPELRVSALDCDSGTRAGQAGPRPASGADPAQPTCGMRVAPGQMVIGGTPMPQFATVLSGFVQRVVLDRTGLDGAYDFRLSWTPARIPQGPPPPGAPSLPPVDPNGPSIFAALQEQLGLRLDAQEAPLEVVVIDQVERPTPD